MCGFCIFLLVGFAWSSWMGCFCGAVGRSVNQPGPTGSCGACEPRPPPPVQSPVAGSAAPSQAWPAGPKWRSTTTGATWSTQSATINLSPPSSPCRSDLEPEVLLKVASQNNQQKNKIIMQAVDQRTKQVYLLFRMGLGGIYQICINKMLSIHDAGLKYHQ